MKAPFALGLMALSIGLAGCHRAPEPMHEDVRPVRSTVVGTSRGSVGATYSGEIQARYESRLGFETSGRIAARLVEVGSAVRRGQPLMRLDPAQETLHLLAADADVEARKSRVAQDRVDLQRTEALQARGFASQAEVDQQRLALAQSESQLKSSLAQRQIKVNQRGYTVLLADRDGVVSGIHAEAGQVVSPGQAVVTLAADGERDVVISIAESRVEELKAARSLRVSVWAQPGKAYVGTLRELAPDTDSVTRTYSARIAVKNPDPGLRLGMTASVFAADVDGSHAIRLPLTAIHHRDRQPQVWVVNPNTAQVSLRAVALGAAQNDEVLVTAGLQPGETVVTAGVYMLHDGQTVKLAGPTEVAAKEQP
jgi:RND family efflux transporter MFP subunit